MNWQSPRLRLFLWLTGAVLLWRATLFAFLYAARITLPVRPNNPHRDFVAFPESPFFDSFARWDSSWYWRIATQGYQGPRSKLAFFPGYPYLTRAVSHLTGDVWSAGLWVSNLALLCALFFVYGIARRYFDEADARRTAIWVLVLPTSFFLSAFYSESLFLLTVAACLYFYERDQLLLAGLCGALAAFTRSAGVLLFPALAWGVLHRAHYRPRQLSPRAAFLLLIPAGLALVGYLQYRAVGDPLAFVKVQAAWGRSSMFPLATLVQQVQAIGPSPQGVQAAFDCFAVLALFAVVAASLHRLDLAHSVFAALSVLVPLSSGLVLSMERFAVCVVPLYLVLTHATRAPQVERYVTYAAALFLALHTVFFANWYFAG